MSKRRCGIMEKLSKERNEKPKHLERSPHSTTTRDSPCAATQTQCSQKEVSFKK